MRPTMMKPGAVTTTTTGGQAAKPTSMLSTELASEGSSHGQIATATSYQYNQNVGGNLVLQQHWLAGSAQPVPHLTRSCCWKGTVVPISVSFFWSFFQGTQSLASLQGEVNRSSCGYERWLRASKPTWPGCCLHSWTARNAYYNTNNTHSWSDASLSSRSVRLFQAMVWPSTAAYAVFSHFWSLVQCAVFSIVEA